MTEIMQSQRVKSADFVFKVATTLVDLLFIENGIEVRGGASS